MATLWRSSERSCSICLLTSWAGSARKVRGVYGSKYLAGLCERVVDIEQQHRVLDWTLVERGVDRCGGGHVEVGAVWEVGWAQDLQCSCERSSSLRIYRGGGKGAIGRAEEGSSCCQISFGGACRDGGSSPLRNAWGSV
jgi:hypothetical protein